MRVAGILIIYLIAVFGGGALLAPWLYHAVQSAAEAYPAFESLARNPFHRFVNRSLMILGVIGLWPLVRALDLGSWSAAGFPPARSWKRLFLKGFLVGFLSLGLVAVLAMTLGAREWRTDLTWSGLSRHLVNACLSALVVAFIEELFFRGILFGGMRKRISWPAALVVSSGLYAILHFFERPSPPERIAWHTGYETLGTMLRGFVDVQTVLPGFLVLFLAGLILGWAYHRSGSLHFSIGLHAGWIFWLKSYNYFTHHSGGPVWFWGTNKMTDGWISLIVMGMVLAMVIRFSRKTMEVNDACRGHSNRALVSKLD